MAKKQESQEGARRSAADGAAVASTSTCSTGCTLVIDSRKGADPDTSYTARLFSRGRQQIAKKLGEEAVEALIEGIRGDQPKLVGESADMLYHLLDPVGGGRREAGGGVGRAGAARGPVGHRRKGRAQAEIAGHADGSPPRA